MKVIHVSRPEVQHKQLIHYLQVNNVDGYVQDPDKKLWIDCANKYLNKGETNINSVVNRWYPDYIILPSTFKLRDVQELWYLNSDTAVVYRARKDEVIDACAQPSIDLVCLSEDRMSFIEIIKRLDKISKSFPLRAIVVELSSIRDLKEKLQLLSNYPQVAYLIEPFSNHCGNLGMVFNHLRGATVDTESAYAVMDTYCKDFEMFVNYNQMLMELWADGQPGISFKEAIKHE